MLFWEKDRHSSLWVNDDNIFFARNLTILEVGVVLQKLRVMRFFMNGLIITVLFALSEYANAAVDQPSLGEAAENMLGPLGLLTEGFYKICYVIGATLLLGAGLQYKNYRNNPSAVRLSTPIVLLLLGIALILLPLIGMLSPASQAANSNS